MCVPLTCAVTGYAEVVTVRRNDVTVSEEFRLSWT